MGSREIAISDIHGCYKTFRELVENKVQLTTDDRLYLLGDYIDRGPDSKAVIDYILTLQKSGFTVKCLLGNHEQLLLKAATDYSYLRIFRSSGGKQTLNSYGLTMSELRYHQHFEFFRNLDYYFELDNYLLVHAGFNFQISAPFLDTYSMLWIRNWHHTIDKSFLNGKTIVHGHTPIQKNDIIEMKRNINETQVLDIDAGCFVNKVMCAFDLTNQQLHFQDCLDEVNY